MKKRAIVLLVFAMLFLLAFSATLISINIISASEEEDYDMRFGMQKDGLWGLVTADGIELTPFVYEKMGRYSEGMRMVIKEGKMGFLDSSGHLPIPLIYDVGICSGCGTYHNNDVVFENGIAQVYLNGKVGYIDRAGNQVCGFVFEDMKSFPNSGMQNDYSDYIAVKENGKWGIATKDFSRVIVPCVYDELELDQSFFQEYIRVNKDEKFGFIDIEGNIVFPIIIDWFFMPKEGLWGYSADGKVGYMDMTMNVVIEPRFDQAESFSDGRAKVQVGGLWGFIDKRGEVVIPAIYQDAIGFSEGLAAVRLDDQWGFVDKLGNLVIPIELIGGGEFKDGLARIKGGVPNIIWSDTDRALVIDKKGNIIVPETTFAAINNDYGDAPEYEEKIKAAHEKMSDWAIQERIGERSDGGSSSSIASKEINNDFRNPMNYDYKKPITRRECTTFLLWLYRQLTGQYFPYPTENPFHDADDIDVRTAYEAGLVVGTGEGVFKPDVYVSRQDFCVMLFRFLKLVREDDDNPIDIVGFTDLHSVSGYAKEAAMFLCGLGLVRGANGKLSPHGQVTREQAMAFAHRIHILCKYDESGESKCLCFY